MKRRKKERLNSTGSSRNVGSDDMLFLKTGLVSFFSSFISVVYPAVEARVLDGFVSLASLAYLRLDSRVPRGNREVCFLGGV